MHRLNFFLLVHIVLLVLLTGFAHADELPSWNETPVKQAILDYVKAVTTPGSEDFVPQPERVAIFDNDGTFTCERPNYASTLFQAGLVRSLIAKGKIDDAKMPFKAWNAFDKDALKKYGWKAAYQEMNAAFGGMPVAAFRDSARAFMDRYVHPRYRVLLPRLYYAPMLELADLLTGHGFQLWVVTGSEQEFMRSFLEDATGVPCLLWATATTISPCAAMLSPESVWDSPSGFTTMIRNGNTNTTREPTTWPTWSRTRTMPGASAWKRIGSKFFRMVFWIKLFDQFIP